MIKSKEASNMYKFQFFHVLKKLISKHYNILCYLTKKLLNNMGNAVSYITDAIEEQPVDSTNQGENVEFSYENLDTYDKNQLTAFIKEIVSKHIDCPEDYFNKMQNLELNATELIPMTIELYKKMFLLFGEYKKTEGTTSVRTKKRVFFVKPQFPISDVKNTIIQRKVIPITNFVVLMEKMPFLTCMNMNDITPLEYNESFNNTLTKKDMMGVTKKMLRDMTDYHKTRFINSFNKILDSTSTGDSKVNMVAIGKGSYVYKANKNGAKNDINSFRQIISIPNVVSQFHRILALRLTNYLQQNKFVDTTIQKGGISGQKFAIFEQYYKLRNVIKDANKNKKTCAVLFLDISNAFGNLSLQQLYKVLDYYGVSDKFIAYLKQYYDNLEYYVDISGQKTENFKWVDGLIQGCAMSPLLFVLCINYVLKFLCKEYETGCGYQLTDSKTKATKEILFVAYMDDICITCKDTNLLGIVYDKIVELFTMLGLPLNHDKSGLMTVNIPKEQINPKFANVTSLKTVKYLGEYISDDGTCSETYIQFLKHVTARLAILDKKNISTEKKIETFTSLIAPWINRKTMIMYDIGKVKTLKIVAIIKPYLEKWNNQQDIQLFYNISPILNESQDEIIKAIEFNDENFDEELENSLDLSNYILKVSPTQLMYNEIDDDTIIDLELEKYESITQD